jgi:hypothetical protein
MKKHFSMFKNMSEINEKFVPEITENQVEITLLVADIFLALVLLWCTVRGLCSWKKLSKKCRQANDNSIYDEIVRKEVYYHECPQSPTESNKTFLVKVFTNCNLLTLSSHISF